MAEPRTSGGEVQFDVPFVLRFDQYRLVAVDDLETLGETSLAANGFMLVAALLWGAFLTGLVEVIAPETLAGYVVIFLLGALGFSIAAMLFWRFRHRLLGRLRASRIDDLAAADQGEQRR